MKKEWKKVLSLVMALAMVLSICPFAFAEGEEVEEVTPVVQTVYDFAEFFETSDEFSGNPATDYDADGLTRVPTPNWKVGIFENGDTPFVDVFTTLNLMVRAGHYSRAICDTKNTTMTLVDGSQSSNVRIPNMMVVYNNSYLRSASPEKTYHHYDGTVSVIGDGGYSNGYHDTDSGNTFFWNYRGGVGYGFGNGTGVPNSGLTASIQGAVIFIVPRSGYIRPTVKVFHDDANGLSDLRFRLYKQDVDDNWTNIYPAEGEAAATITAGGSWTSSERLINGWVPVSQNSSVTRDDARLWVEAGEKIVLRVGSVTPSGGAYAIDTLKFEYITELDDLNSGYFPDTRMADVREAALPERTVYTVPEDSGLIPTDVPGIFSVDESYVDGTPVTVTITVDDVVFSREITLVSAIYDAAEAFYVQGDFSAGKTAAEKYATNPMTPKTPNDGTGLWSVGYYPYSDLGLFRYYDGFGRMKNYRAYEDTTYNRTASMVWGYSGGYWRQVKLEGDPGWLSVDADGGWSLCEVNTAYGSVGYSFGKDAYIANGAISHGSSNTMQPSIVFVAPIDGVINPYLEAAATDAGNVAYRMYKEDALTGELTQIYPLVTDPDQIQLKKNDGTVYDVSKYVDNNWGLLPKGSSGYMVQDEGLVRVKKGDKIVTRFSGHGVASKYYGLKQLTMNYLGRFGEDDELLMSAPFANYEETYDLVTPRDKMVDLSRELLNPEAKGTMEYTITGNAEILRETADAGVYELTGEINAGGEAATVTAAYYSKGKSSANGDKPLYTTSTEVYVNAASMAVDTFSYDLFKSTQLGYDNDGFLLPYYTNETERAMYGEIDLGLADEWVNSTVTFTLKGAEGKEVKTNKVEYLGNGRVRVLAKHDYTDAGGTYPSHGHKVPPTTTAPSYNGVVAVRDTTTAGANPIVMTVKASDGGVRKFNIWTFNTTVHGDVASETYGFDAANYYVGNSVTQLEAYIDMTATNGGSFEPMYRDNGKNTHITPVADDMYVQGGSESYWDQRVPGFTYDNRIDFWSLNETQWKAMTNSPYVDYDGVAYAFVAPKDGMVKVANYLTEMLHSTTGYFNQGQGIRVGEVRHYKQNGTYETLIKYDYTDCSGFDIVHDEGTFSTADPAYRVPAYLRVGTKSGTMIDSLETDNTLNVTVKKGETIRIILAGDTDTNWVFNYKRTSADTPGITYLPNPTFTYQYAEYPDEFGDGYFLDVNPMADGMTVENVFTLFYNEAGELLTVSTQAFGGSSEDGYFSIAVPSVSTAYAKVFFWDSLTNIQPLASDIMVRK